ncbi:MAG: Tol-Pal system beta propeller repeat protein TolB, partial [Nitrospinota bacterium]|nr:Tol-Pal system beta propeller repeat protein TolB [Nitrospinota bacterium]
MRKGIETLLIGAALFLCAGQVAWAQTAPDVRIGSTRTESRLVEVAVVDFSLTGSDTLGFGAMASKVINFDLGFSGFFKAVPQREFILEYDAKDRKNGTVDYDAWKTISSNFLVKGKIIPEDETKIAVEVVVYDLQRRQMDFGKRYTGPVSMYRQILHQFSDDFLYRYAGETGVARSKMLFISAVRGRKELMVVDYDGDNPRQLTTERTLVLSPAWNHANKNLALFTTYRYRNPDLYVMDLTNMQRYPLSTAVGLNSTGDWSPDGTRVAFALSKQGNTDIYIVNADGRGLTRLTSERSAELNPSWSPDGQKLAFTSDMGGTPQIYIMNSDGTGRERFSYTGRYCDGAAWSPKGDMIAYASLVYDNFDIVVQQIRDRAAQIITEGYGKGNSESPSWAPDGRHLAFSSTNSGNRQLYISGLTGGAPLPITNLPGGGSQPSWG